MSFCEECILLPCSSTQTTCIHYANRVNLDQSSSNTFSQLALPTALLYSHLDSSDTPSQPTPPLMSFAIDQPPDTIGLGENLPSVSNNSCDNVGEDLSSRVLPDQVNQNTKTRLNIASINVCGLKSRVNYPEFIQLIQRYDIVCISETKLDQYDIIECPNYTFLSKPRTEKYKRKSGGIGFFVHNKLIDNTVTIESKCEYIFWLKLTGINAREIVIGAMYVPPDTSKFYNADEFFQMETDVSVKCSNCMTHWRKM